MFANIDRTTFFPSLFSSELFFFLLKQPNITAVKKGKVGFIAIVQRRKITACNILKSDDVKPAHFSHFFIKHGGVHKNNLLGLYLHSVG